MLPCRVRQGAELPILASACTRKNFANSLVGKSLALFIGPALCTAKEIQEAIPKLSREELQQIREWIDDYLEDHLELTDEVKAKLDQSRAEMPPANTRSGNQNRLWWWRFRFARRHSQTRSTRFQAPSALLSSKRWTKWARD